MKSIALIPLRGGSKSIPLKNIKLIAGKPLCYWTIKAALDSEIFQEVYVSTDSVEIKRVVNELFPRTIVKIVDRPVEFATDSASTESVMLDFAVNHEFDMLCLIQATSPLVQSRDFISAYKKFNEESLDSLLTGCLMKRFFWSLDNSPLNYDPLKRPRRQDFNGTVIENGAFYFTKKATLLKNSNRLGGKIGIHVMDEEALVELDEPSDWPLVETVLLNKLKSEMNWKGLKAIIIDVDGTLTDSGMYYSKDGEFLKKFNTRDAHAIGMARQQGIKICIATAEDSPSVHSRFQKVKVDQYFFGEKEKLSYLLKWLEQEKINKEEVLYIGDDLGDLDCFKYFSKTGCPFDAVPRIRSLSKFISTKSGGDGAVRDIIDSLVLEIC